MAVSPYCAATGNDRHDRVGNKHRAAVTPVRFPQRPYFVLASRVRASGPETSTEKDEVNRETHTFGKRRLMELHRFENLDEYTPAGHVGVVNRLLVGAGLGGDSAVSVWHGRLEPGGHSDLHIHETSLQAYVGISGSLIVGNGNREELLHPMDTVVFPRGTTHFIENRSESEAEVLVISAPGLK